MAKILHTSLGGIKTTSIKKVVRDHKEDHKESVREPKGITECPKCHNVRFKKTWRASFEDVQKLSKKELTISRKEICPACKMIKEHLFEGELFIEEFPKQQKKELFNLIRNFGERATEINPQDRIIKIEEIDKGYRIITTENQLVNRLAKKIKDVFNLVKIKFSHSKEPYKVSRVYVTYHDK